jgi:hypothetical protein
MFIIMWNPSGFYVIHRLPKDAKISEIYRPDEEEESGECAIPEEKDEEVSEDILPDDLYPGTNNNE